jgi:hypothetical protein
MWKELTAIPARVGAAVSRRDGHVTATAGGRLPLPFILTNTYIKVTGKCFANFLPDFKA